MSCSPSRPANRTADFEVTPAETSVTVASPVIMPTFSGPRTWQRERNSSLARALIGNGVLGAAALAEGFELEGEGDEGFPRTGGGVEDDVVAGKEFENGFFLVVVGFGAGSGEVVEEGVEDVVRRGVFGEILAAERCGHAGIVAEEEFTAKAQLHDFTGDIEALFKGQGR